LAGSGATTVGSVAGVRDEDILTFDGANFAMLFDGSDVGAGGVDVDAFSVLNSTTLLISFDNSVSLPGAGAVDDRDIVQFNATSLGANTSGTYSLFFDGNSAGLDASSEDIDAFERLSDGRLVVSARGNVSVPGLSAKDEDLIVFDPSNSSWAMYFQGTDVALAAADEDVDAAAVAGNGDLYLSSLGLFSVSGLSGDNEDVFVCNSPTTGTNTACSSFSLFFDGSAFGLAGNDIDAIDLP
jgi:hypothetical protein